MHKLLKRFLIAILIILSVYLVLLIPFYSKEHRIQSHQFPFSWNSDSLWNKLEADFAAGRKLDTVILQSKIASFFQIEEKLCHEMESRTIPLNDSVYDAALFQFFSLSALVAAQPQYIHQLNILYSRIRTDVKLQSQQWDMTCTDTRNSLYKMLYGLRAAVEEVALQNNSMENILLGKQEHSSTPSTNILGITVHSGDLLVSRGGAEVSAFISRGNDYPGNFSHVALMYIDEASKIPYLIEAHIEKGVAVSSVADYVKDKKLRFMVLRPRFDLQQLKTDSMLPQKAARYAMNEAAKRHIPYDFKMNYDDSSAMFCSEVGSYAYRKNGLQLWKAVSTISSPGVESWLQSFGVEHFVTQMPADLEYDPQLTIVAEWKDEQTLFKDHLDNAVMDALLAEADKGKEIGYNSWKLPVARVLKAYCTVLNLFGKVGKIPEGMSAIQAMKNVEFVNMFQQVKTAVVQHANNFTAQKKYRPPYWQLVKMANTEAESYFRK
jgi:Permuted papain-like amidase enzyme, YaeF/YiiX, C92 family